MLNYTLTAKQYDELAGLAYHHSVRAYNLEMYGNDYPELSQDDDNIRQHFCELDALGVPMWVQNHALKWSQDWRRVAREYLYQYLSKYNIKVSRR